MAESRDGNPEQEAIIDKAVAASRNLVRHLRMLDYEACAEIAARQPTGLAAAAEILRTLRGSQEKTE